MLELDSIDIKPMIVDTTCLENSCLNNHVMPKSKESGTQGKFVPTCHNCWKIGHIRPNCYLLKSHRPWIKQDALRKSEVEDSSSAKYVPPHRRHIKAPKVEGSEEAANKSYIRHSTSYDTSGFTASAAFCSCLSEWQIKEEQTKALQEEAAEAH
jgi:hypothetical protein